MECISMNYVDFDLNLLKIFVSVYENGGIVITSKKLFISQPAVSMSIKKLEKVVGAPLFIRLPKGVKPTKFGETFYDYCKKALKQIQLAVENAKETDCLSNGNINIGASHDLINYFLMPKVVEFAKQYPNISINFIETIPNHLSKYIERGEIDIVFLEDKKLQNNFECFEVARFDNCFFEKNNTNSDNRSNQIDMQDIAIFKQNTSNYQSFAKLELNIMPKYNVANFDTMCKLVDDNLCIGFAPLQYIDKNKYNIIKTNFNIEQTTINMCFLKQDLSFASKEFAKMFK